MNHAEELDPRSLMVNGLGATPLLESRQYDAAIEQANKVLLMDPSSGLGHWVLLTAYERKGDLARAIDEREKQATLWGRSPADAAKQTARLRNAYASSAANGYWQTLLASMEPDLAKQGADPYGAAVVLARAGEKSRALAALEKSCAARSTELLYWLNGEPAFDSLRGDPRFQDLLRRIGMHSPSGS
jgi:predicted Zn-dependent protease